jgi:hypothetical protein
MEPRMVGQVSVADAAERLGLDESRVRQLLRSGELAGQHLGRVWLVDADGVARRAGRGAGSARPMAPARAWGLLDLLDGRAASWLTSQARSQVRALMRGLPDATPDRWRAALRARSTVHVVRAHPGVLSRILADPHIVVAGVDRAVRAGLDLVAISAVPEVYVREVDWPTLVEDYALLPRAGEPNLVVRIPRTVWPFEGAEAGPATFAADLVEADEPRARSAGAAWLNAHVRQSVPSPDRCSIAHTSPGHSRPQHSGRTALPPSESF